MTERPQLKDKLAKLASEESVIEDGWRRIGVSDPQKPLSAIATEIDETLYPVKISLRNTVGDVVVLAAGNRRLRCILGPLPNAQQQYEPVCGVELTEANTDALDQVSKLLQAHALDDMSLWVRTTEMPETGTVAGGGVPAAKLAELWKIASSGKPALDPETAFNDFADELTDRSNRWARLSGRQVDASSDASFENVEAVLDFAASLSSPVSGQDRGQAGLVVIGAENALHIVVAEYNDNSVVAEIAGSDVADMHAFWRRAGL